MKHKKVIILIVFIAFLLLTGGLAIWMVKRSEVIEITLEQGEDYQIIFDETVGYVEDPEYTSSDYSVANICAGKYIYAQNVGEAILTVNCKDKKIKYKVIVNGGEKSAPVLYSDTENKGKIGYGYYAILDYGIYEDSVLNEVLDWNKLLSESLVKRDVSSNYDFCVTSESTIDKFLNSAISKSEYKISAKVFGRKVSKKRESIDVKIDSAALVSSINQIYCRKGYYYIYIEKDKRELWKYVNDNVKEDLYGEKALPAEKLFKKYGTHVLTGVLMGGNFVCNYTLSGTNETVKYTKLMEFYSAGYVFDNFNSVMSKYGIKWDVPFRNELEDYFELFDDRYVGFHNDVYKAAYCLENDAAEFDKTEQRNRSLKTDWYYRIRGGAEALVLDKSTNYNTGYAAMAGISIWLKYQLNEKSSVLIGLKDMNGAIAIWDLIPDKNTVNKARYEELKNEYNKLIQTMED